MRLRANPNRVHSHLPQFMFGAQMNTLCIMKATFSCLLGGHITPQGAPIMLTIEPRVASIFSMMLNLKNTCLSYVCS